MKKTIVFEIILIFILIVTGWYLLGIMKHAESNSPELRAIESYNRLVFTGGAGIDVLGNKVGSIHTDTNDDVERFVVSFLLRYDSLEADLKFWNEVDVHLSKIASVRLAAYCENDQCIDVIRKSPDIAHFPVLEYGRAGDMQAVIGADATGEFWLAGNGYKKIIWRDEALTSYDVAMSIGLGL